MNIKMLLFFFAVKSKHRMYQRAIYLYTLLVYLAGCLYVCLCPINVKTAEPLRPKCQVIPGKVYE